MHHLYRTVLRTLVLALVLTLVHAPTPARAQDPTPLGRASREPATEAVSQSILDRLFVLEHRLHALEAELMALRSRLAALESRTDA